MKVMILSNWMRTSFLASLGCPVMFRVLRMSFVRLSMSIAVCITFVGSPLLLRVSSGFGSKGTACILASGGALLLGFMGATRISASGVVSLVRGVLACSMVGCSTLAF